MRILWRGDEGYEQARLDVVWHARKPARYPDGIAFAQSRQDVVDAVRLARERGLKVKARSGGHSWTASSVRDGGLLIDLSGLGAWAVDADAGTAMVEPGAKGRDLNEGLAEHGLFFPTGHCPTIALGGFLLQGGWGWTSRALGPACMSVTAVDVVTADGELVHASETENADLLWAARGAGSGFFGIVVGYHLRCHPRPASMMRSMYAYSLDEADELMRWAHAMQPEWPAALELQFMGSFPRNPDASPTAEGDAMIMVIGFALFDSEEESVAALRLLEAAPVRDKALLAEVCVPSTLDELYELVDSYARPEVAYAGDSLWSDDGADELVPAFLEMVRDMPTRWSYVLWWPWVPQALDGVALSVTGKHYISPFSGWADPADEAEVAAWPGEHMRRLDHLSKGIQLADENLLGRPDARYMTDENAARLEALRATWDPEGRFHSFLFGDARAAAGATST
jgi:FAD/FMN-containing dehydrogenase